MLFEFFFKMLFALVTIFVYQSMRLAKNRKQGCQQEGGRKKKLLK
jgi:hypothetical protein